MHLYENRVIHTLRRLPRSKELIAHVKEVTNPPIVVRNIADPQVKSIVALHTYTHTYIQYILYLIAANLSNH